MREVPGGGRIGRIGPAVDFFDRGDLEGVLGADDILDRVKRVQARFFRVSLAVGAARRASIFSRHSPPTSPRKDRGKRRAGERVGRERRGEEKGGGGGPEKIEGLDLPERWEDMKEEKVGWSEWRGFKYEAWLGSCAKPRASASQCISGGPRCHAAVNGARPGAGADGECRGTAYAMRR